MAEVDAREAQRRDRSSPQAQKHLSSSIPHPLPLFDHDRNLLADVLHDAIHLDIIPIEPERVLELAGDAVDAVEGEGHEDDDGDGPPCHLGDEREGEDHAESC